MLAYREDERGGTVVHTAALDVIDDGPQKVVQIWNRIGQRPILAAGNANGDVPMLRFAGGDRPTLRLLVHHDDAAREFAYDAGAERALAEAEGQGWTVVSVQHDWRPCFET